MSERSHLEELYSGLAPRGDCLIQSCVIMHEHREDLVFSVPDLIPSPYVVMILLVQIALKREKKKRQEKKKNSNKQRNKYSK